MCEFQFKYPVQVFNRETKQYENDIRQGTSYEIEAAMTEVVSAFHGFVKHDCYLSKYWEHILKTVQGQCEGHNCNVTARDIQFITAFIDGLNNLTSVQKKYCDVNISDIAIPCWLSEYVLPRKVFFDLEDVDTANDILAHIDESDIRYLCPDLFDKFEVPVAEGSKDMKVVKEWHGVSYQEFHNACVKVWNNLRTRTGDRTWTDVAPLTQPVAVTSDLLRASTMTGMLAVDDRRPIPVNIHVWSSGKLKYPALDVMTVKLQRAIWNMDGDSK